MRREDGFLHREDEPTRPVRVPRLNLKVLNDTSRIIRVDLDSPPPPREPTQKIPPR
ncbi:MAG TPA: hypothetical protein VGL86_07065 [Polyangia bacterium]|jgi:hypothetical protein